jgi:hypothetical protein
MSWSKEVARFSDSTMPIAKKEYKTKIGKFDHRLLKYYEDNPRIYTAIREAGTPDQDSIQDHLQSLPHVQKLKKDIETQGGNQEAIIVRDHTFEVLEGNSRLAAFRDLPGVKFQQINCVFLPEEITEKHVFILLGQTHINGRTPWAKHEQARYLQRMEEQGGDLNELSINIGLSSGEGRKYVATIELMETHKDRKNDNFSSWHAYLSNRKAQEAKIEHPELEKRLASAIKTGSFKKATDFRDALTPVCSDRKALKMLLNNKRDLEECYQFVKENGATTPVVKRARTAMQRLSDITRDDLNKITTKQLNSVQRDLKKAKQKVGSLLKIVISIKEEEFSND